MNKDTLKSNINKAMEILGEVVGISPDVFVFVIADKEGEACVHMHGQEDKICCAVNELMGQTVAKFPQTMQEVIMAEILANAKATKVN